MIMLHGVLFMPPPPMDTQYWMIDLLLEQDSLSWINCMPSCWHFNRTSGPRMTADDGGSDTK